MEQAFEKQTFAKRLKSIFKVDFKRMFTMPLVYIMAGVSLAMPILILVMTSMMSGAEAGTDATGTFTNVWQAISSISGSAMTMDLTGMCNINMLYFLAAVLVCVFVAEDFRSGYAKNLFAVRSKKIDYVFSKSLVCYVGVAIMFAAFFIGAMIGGAIAGLTFDVGTAGVSGIVACLFSKMFLIAVFTSIQLLLSVVAKQRTWMSILGSCVIGMLLFTMIPMIAPLDSSILNVVLCFAGGALFAAGLGAIDNIILNKTSLV